MIDLLILLAFVTYSIGNGFRHRSRASRNLEEYFLAGRSVRGWRAGVSLAATQFAADTPLLVTGLIATGGSDLRIAFSCLELDDVEPLFEVIHRGIQELRDE